MFMGEIMCLFVYYAMKVQSGGSSVDRVEESPTETSPLVPQEPVVEEEAQHHPIEMEGSYNLLLAVPTVCDLTGTTLMNVGLIYVSASVYQMLRGSIVLFTGILSVVLLKRDHPAYRWFALITVFAGVAIVGLSGSMTSNASTVTLSDSLFGVCLVVLAQIFTALQFVVEEKIMSRFNVPAIKAVGLEGLFGLIFVGIAMPVLHFFSHKGSRLDMIEGFHQIADNPQVLYAGIGIIFSIAFFNWFGLSVTRNISATSRSMIDTCRTLFIWIVSLSLGWESFKWAQVVGFIVLVYGTLVFNDVVAPPPFICAKTNETQQE